MVADNKETNITPCPCCGQQRPYPTEPGKWRYRTHPSPWWFNVTVAFDSEGLTITPEGETEPVWWPENARWEQLE